ncbi:hypothetical protein Lalb_Chr13g0293151 [Lupinus albus]|uniref:Uncharacterized protein n=1 Tax=Lupinus albus TaxID=3870 RepID=A0A6A4PHV0_LUPAL|nr:hypothetical protein Lalb_Chr13g0293151 [Lupinus albus]
MLQNMERHKLIYFNKFLELGDVNLEILVIHVEEAEPNVRRSYADTLDLTKEELVKIILSYIIDYVVVLDFPINTNRDVDALIQNDVIVNWLGDTDSMTNNYNGPWKNITQLNFCSHYIHLCLDLNAFCTLMNYKDIVNDIKGMLERAESPITSDCCIYRVPFDISLLNQDVYIPKVVSISHIHHLNPRLQNMEIHKLIYFNKFLNLAEPNVRRSYDDTLDLTTEELVKIILVDSCLIIELFWRFCYNEWSGCDVFLLKPWLTTKIRLDLLLIENQLPFFVLESIYNRALISSSGNIPSFLVVTFNYFSYYNSCNLASEKYNHKTLHRFA